MARNGQQSVYGLAAASKQLRVIKKGGAGMHSWECCNVRPALVGETAASLPPGAPPTLSSPPAPPPHVCVCLGVGGADAYRRAVELNGRDYRAWYGLGQTYELLHMPFYALHYYRQATQLRPHDARMWCVNIQHPPRPLLAL